MLCGGWEESMGAPYGDGLHPPHFSAPPTLKLCRQQAEMCWTRSENRDQTAWTIIHYIRLDCCGGGGETQGIDQSSLLVKMWGVINLSCPQYIVLHCKVFTSQRHLTWTRAPQSYWSAFSPQQDQKLSNLGRNGFATTVPWVSGKSEVRGGEQFLLICVVQELQRTPRSVALRYCVSSMGCYYSSYSSPFTQQSKEQENNVISLYCRYDYSGENRSSLLCLIWSSVFE